MENSNFGENNKDKSSFLSSVFPFLAIVVVAVILSLVLCNHMQKRDIQEKETRMQAVAGKEISILVALPGENQIDQEDITNANYLKYEAIIEDFYKSDSLDIIYVKCGGEAGKIYINKYDRSQRTLNWYNLGENDLEIPFLYSSDFLIIGDYPAEQ